MIVELIGVPFDGMGRPGAQARAPAALRAAGLEAAFTGREVLVRPDLAVPAPLAERDPVSGLLNEPALLGMIQALYPCVSAALSAGRFPLVYGADCSVLLAAVPALRDVAAEAGLVFIDGHEDATPMEASPDGEAANMEIALLLGLTGEQAPERLRARLPALQTYALALLGPRDRPERLERNVSTLADRVLLRTPDQLCANPCESAREAVRHVTSRTPGWWLHTDLDVLADNEFSARGAPGEMLLPGGLIWSQLTELVSCALRAGGCRGWSLVIYNPDLDADGSAARRIVRFVSDVAPRLP
jgi:arginase